LPISTILLFTFGTDPTVWCFFFPFNCMPANLVSLKTRLSLLHHKVQLKFWRKKMLWPDRWPHDQTNKHKHEL